MQPDDPRAALASVIGDLRAYSPLSRTSWPVAPVEVCRWCNISQKSCHEDKHANHCLITKLEMLAAALSGSDIEVQPGMFRAQHSTSVFAPEPASAIAFPLEQNDQGEGTRVGDSATAASHEPKRAWWRVHPNPASIDRELMVLQEVCDWMRDWQNEGLALEGQSLELELVFLTDAEVQALPDV